MFWVTPSHKAAEKTLIKKLCLELGIPRWLLNPKPQQIFQVKWNSPEDFGFSTLLLVLLGRRWHQGSHLPRATHWMKGKISIYTQSPFASEFSRGGPRNVGDTSQGSDGILIGLKKIKLWKSIYNTKGVIFTIFFFLADACRIWVPWPGIEPAPPAWRAWGLNHWTTREVPLHYF